MLLRIGREYGKIVRAPTLMNLKDERLLASAVADKKGESVLWLLLKTRLDTVL
jgi:hypothetical protein